MNITQCDACGIELDEGQTDGESVRIALPGDDTEEQLYLYIKVGDDDGEPVDKHYCPSCAANMLKLAIENEESGVGNMDWAKGIDLSSINGGGDDEEDEVEDDETDESDDEEEDEMP